jgi:hypothetical protein
VRLEHVALHRRGRGTWAEAGIATASFRAILKYWFTGQAG